MPDEKLISEFDRLIHQLSQLLEDIPSYPGDRYSQPMPSYLNDEQSEKFENLRAEALVLLKKIRTTDYAYKSAIQYIRDAKPVRMYLEQILDDLKSLRVTYISDTFEEQSNDNEDRPGFWLRLGRIALVLGIVVSILTVIQFYFSIEDRFVQESEVIPTIEVEITPEVTQDFEP